MDERRQGGAVGTGRPVSMAAVAEAAGVSQQTVSRVVNGLACVKDETRQRVERAMDELGFRPNFAGRTLRGGSYRAVGLCTSDITRAGNLAILAGIADAARSRGFAISMVELDPNGPCTLAAASRRMAELPIDGLIISMTRMAEDFETFRPLPGLRTAVLTSREHASVTTVDSDQLGCSQMVVDHLSALGHRQIRFVSGPVASIAGHFRLKGWREALAERGLSVVEPLVGDWTANSGYEAGVRIAEEDPGATAIYAANDQMALGVIAALRDRGVRVPQDVSVVGVDDSLEGIVPNNDLTTVRFDVRTCGRVLFESVTAGAADGGAAVAEGAADAGESGAGAQAAGIGAHNIRIPGELIERATTAPVR